MMLKKYLNLIGRKFRRKSNRVANYLIVAALNFKVKILKSDEMELHDCQFLGF
ncbi:hypothetical protein ACVWYG_000643 [Pedobacter sp. UYEF25]